MGHIKQTGVQSLYNYSECFDFIWAETSGDVWVETTDRESVRVLDISVEFPCKDISNTHFSQFESFFLLGFWAQKKKSGGFRRTFFIINFFPFSKANKSIAVQGFFFSLACFFSQKCTNNQSHYLVDTFRINGPNFARISQVRGLVQGSLWTFCDFEKNRVMPEVLSYYTLSSIFVSSLWLEREMAEMHNLQFLGHPDLRYLLLDYGLQNLYDRHEKEA